MQNEMTMIAAPGASQSSNVHKMARTRQEKERERKKEEETRRSVCYTKWMYFKIKGTVFQKSGVLAETSVRLPTSRHDLYLV